MENIAEIVFPIPLRRTFDYEVPGSLSTLQPGMRVEVPFGHQVTTGYCLLRKSASDFDKLKPIRKILDPVPLLLPSLLKLASWMAGYYGSSTGEALDSMLPPGIRKRTRPAPKDKCCVLCGTAENWAQCAADLKNRAPRQSVVLCALIAAGGSLLRKTLLEQPGVQAPAIRALEKKGLLKQEAQTSMPHLHKASSGVLAAKDILNLTQEQTHILQKITPSLHAKQHHKSFLIHGVTGSGKTEIYIRAIEAVLKQGRQALMLVPEISLTPQTLARFEARFERMAVLHSHLGEAERASQWRRIRQGDADVVVGARSGVFAPLERLGLIVVDEEQDNSFKQEQTPHYHGRDVAVMRGHMEKIPVILGSATPALESIYNVKIEKYRGFRMTRRPGCAVLPEVRIIDLKHAYAHKRMRKNLAADLYDKINETLARGEQVMLLLNRRGYATYIYCRNCGYVARCNNCDVTLTYHQTTNRLLCHLCGEHLAAPKTCPDCASEQTHYLGAGTQKIEEEIQALFPNARIQRMDSDTTRKRLSHQRILERFAQGEFDILVGTQMIAKGLDFAKVTLVGVISADVTLNMPDFRASERTFALLTQVTGRAGRSDRPGLVMIQTFHPAHEAIAMAAAHDVDGFFEKELSLRRELHYPPFTRLLRVVISSENQDLVPPAAKRAQAICREILSPEKHLVSMPCPAAFAKLNKRFRWHVLIKSFSQKQWPDLMDVLHKRFAKDKGLRVTVDVDPQSLL